MPAPRARHSAFFRDDATNGCSLPGNTVRAGFFLLATLFLVSSPAIARTNRVMNQCDYVRVNLASGQLEKSGTPRLVEMLHGTSGKAVAFQDGYAVLSRPEMDLYADSPSGHFRVHYDVSDTSENAVNPTDTDLNGVPDYVDSALVLLEYARELLVTLGYDAPLTDEGRGGSDATDVYLFDLSIYSYYGYTSPEGTSYIGSSYLVLDNNYTDSVYPTRGLDGLRITAAHELFHAVHFTYYGGYDATWWMEQTAVWFEDYAWDTVNDYLNYLHLFLGNREVALDASGQSMYGAALFAFMLEKQHGPVLLRSVWETFRSSESGAIALLDDIIPTGLPAALSDLAVWCYFTGSRATPDFFRDAALMTDMVTAGNTVQKFPAAGTVTCRRYCFKYIEIAPASGIGPDDVLTLTLTDESGGTWEKRLIFYNSPTDYEVVAVEGMEYTIHPSRSFDHAALAVSNTAPGYGYYTLGYSVETTPFTLGINYPNPFATETTIPFTLPVSVPVTLCIRNSLGQPVSTLIDETLSAGTFSTPFTVTGRSLASGVYFIELRAGNTRLVRKMTILK